MPCYLLRFLLVPPQLAQVVTQRNVLWLVNRRMKGLVCFTIQLACHLHVDKNGLFLTEVFIFIYTPQRTRKKNRSMNMIWNSEFNDWSHVYSNHCSTKLALVVENMLHVRITELSKVYSFRRTPHSVRGEYWDDKLLNLMLCSHSVTLCQ